MECGELPLTTRDGIAYLVQGDLSLLDSPGEFFVDSSAGYVYYYPRSTPIANQVIQAPKVTDIFRIVGANESSLVQHVTFEGLSFEVSDSVAAESASQLLYTCPASMIYMRNTQDLTVRDCYLKNAGLSGILMRYYNKSNEVYGNYIQGTGVSGVSLVGYNPAEAGRSDANRDNLIENNRIEMIGLHHTEAAPIYVSYSGHNRVVNNQIAYSPRYLLGSGTYAGISSSDNYFEANYFGYNDALRGGEDSADLGLLQFFGTVASSEGNTLQQSVFDTAHWQADAGLLEGIQAGIYGVYFDNENEYWTVSNVVVRNVDTTGAAGSNDTFDHTGGTKFDTFTVANLSSESGFNNSLIDYKNIGLKPDFPAKYGNNGYVWVNNTDAGITYSGSWIANPFAGDFAGDEKYSATAGDYAEYTFNGTEVKWATATSFDSGKADVYIDGIFDATIDQYTAATTRQRVVYQKKGLTEGQHKIKIVVRNDKNASSNGYYTVIDALGAASANINDRQFTYSGSWTYGNYAGDYAGGERYSNKPGDYAEYTFLGTGVRWLTATSLDSGKADVYIDGQLEKIVDQYTASTIRQNQVFEKRGLSEGLHTIRIVVRNDKNTSSNGYYTVIDALQITPIGAATYVNNTSFTAFGSWTTASNAADLNGDERYSNTVGNHLEYTFTGREVKWLAATYADSGKADVYIDGNLDATVDQYSAGTQRQQIVYNRTGLSAGSHTIRIVVRNDKNAASNGYYTVVDALVYR